RFRRSRRQAAPDAHGAQRRRDRAHSLRLATHRSIHSGAGGKSARGPARGRDSGDHRAVYLKAGGYAGIHFISSMPMREPDFPVPSQFHSSRKLQKGDALISEISGAYSGYSGQIHRTFSIGEAPTPQWQKMHDAALEAFELLSQVIKDGATTT